MDYFCGIVVCLRDQTLYVSVVIDSLQYLENLPPSLFYVDLVIVSSLLEPTVSSTPRSRTGIIRLGTGRRHGFAVI